MIDLPSPAPHGFPDNLDVYLEFISEQVADVRFLMYWAFALLVLQLMTEIIRLVRRG